MSKFVSVACKVNGQFLQKAIFNRKEKTDITFGFKYTYMYINNTSLILNQFFFHVLLKNLFYIFYVQICFTASEA